MDSFGTLDRSGAINPDWVRVAITFETNNALELNMVRRMISGENGDVDFSSLIPKPENMVHFLDDDEYAALDEVQRMEYDRAVEENRIGDGWERINWGCDINADSAEWTSSTLRFDVTYNAPKMFLEKLAELLWKEGVSFHGYAVPNKFKTCKELKFRTDGGKVEYGFPENFRQLICEEWDIPVEEADDILGTEKSEIKRITYLKKLPPDAVRAPAPIRRKVVLDEESRTSDGGFIPKAVGFLCKVFG